MKALLPFILLALINNINLKLEDTNYDLIIKASISTETHLWKDSTFALTTNVTNPYLIFDALDIEKQIFETTLRWKDISMTIKCNLWKPLYERLLVICDLRDDPLKFNHNEFSMDDYEFTYKDKKIKIISDGFNVIVNYPFVYCDQQNIDLNVEQDAYYFKFKAGLFYDTNLFLRDINRYQMPLYVPFDGCEVKDREMTCKMMRKKIESFASFSQGSDKAIYSTMSFNKEYGFKMNFLISIILLKNTKKQKQDIYVELQNLISIKEESYRYIAYKTNITNLPFIQTTAFSFNFKNLNSSKVYERPCFFKNDGDNAPLMFLCKMEKEENNILILDDFQSQKTYTEFHQNYNFIISYPKRESFTITEGLGNYFNAKYPDVLDFSTKNEINFTLTGIVNDIHKFISNSKSEGLVCDYPLLLVVNCKVTKSHFEGEKSGDFSLYYINTLGEKSKIYEISPFKVILSESTSGSNFTKFNKLIYMLMLLLFI